VILGTDEITAVKVDQEEMVVPIGTDQTKMKLDDVAAEVARETLIKTKTEIRKNVKGKTERDLPVHPRDQNINPYSVWIGLNHSWLTFRTATTTRTMTTRRGHGQH